jgi:hypothetical protein
MHVPLIAGEFVPAGLSDFEGRNGQKGWIGLVSEERGLTGLVKDVMKRRDGIKREEGGQALS